MLPWHLALEELCCSSRSIASALSNGTSAPDCTARLMSRRLWRLVRGQNCLAYNTTCSRTRQREDLVDQASSFARSKEKVSPLHHSIANDFPTIRARRCVPPCREDAEVAPRAADLAAFSFARRRSHAIRNLEPTADGVPVQCGNRELRRLLQAVERLVGMEAEKIEPGCDLGDIAMFAPAEKNFLAWPRSTMTCTLSSKARLENRFVSLMHHFERVGFRRGSSSFDDGEPVFRAILDERLDLRFGHGSMELFRLLMGLDEAAEEMLAMRSASRAGSMWPAGSYSCRSSSFMPRGCRSPRYDRGRLLGRGLLENGLEEVPRSAV